jgi:excisionase family DNA binding protein
MRVDELRLLTVEQVAEILAQSTVTVRRKVATGALEAVRLGSSGPLRILESALAKHLRPARAVTRRTT